MLYTYVDISIFIYSLWKLKEVAIGINIYINKVSKLTQTTSY